MSNENRIALLIDCDNASPATVEGVLEELANHGVVNIRHAHGDWNSNNLAGWIEKLHPNAVRPVQQFAYTSGKNATDAAMIIDAMDLLYSGVVDVFALMTSDSDFTPLVMRIRESGHPVHGFGEGKTPLPFVHACSQFIYTENLRTDGCPEQGTGEPAVRKSTRNELRGDTYLVRLLRTAVEQTSEDDGWAPLSNVGHFISNNSSFSPLNYGYRKLGELIRASELFATEMRKDGTAMYVRDARRLRAETAAEARQ